MKFIPCRERDESEEEEKRAACGSATIAKPQARETATGPIYLLSGRIFGISLTMASMSPSFNSPFLKARLDLTMCLV